MKGERRHELEQNQLADWLAQKIEAIKPYQNLIFGTVAVIAVLVGGYSWWVRQGTSEAEAGWDQFYLAMNRGGSGAAPADFERMAEEYAGTRVGPWAAVMAGDLRLGRGCRELFLDKTTANEELREAVAQYELVRNGRYSPVLKQRATFGMARAREAQNKLDEAISLYEDVGTTWPDGIYAEPARQRLADLKKKSTRSFYDEFKQFNPKRSLVDEPGIPGQRLPFESESLPDGPVFKQPIMDPGSADKGDDAGDATAPDEPDTPGAEPKAPPADTPPVEPKTGETPDQPGGADPPSATPAE